MRNDSGEPPPAKRSKADTRTWRKVCQKQQHSSREASGCRGRGRWRRCCSRPGSASASGRPSAAAASGRRRWPARGSRARSAGMPLAPLRPRRPFPPSKRRCDSRRERARALASRRSPGTAATKSPSSSASQAAARRCHSSSYRSASEPHTLTAELAAECVDPDRQMSWFSLRERAGAARGLRSISNVLHRVA